MPRISELEVAKRAVVDGLVPESVLQECLAEKRRARADGLELTLRELLLEKGYVSAAGWEALERKASVPDTRSELEPGEDVKPVAKKRPSQLVSESGRLVPSADVLGDYRIVKELGRGAMGVVYEAIQTTLGRRVALKVMPAGSALSGVARERFLREARAAASLAHPNIVPIFDQGEERGVPFFAMELIRGRTLKQVLAAEGPLAPLRAARLAAQAARALEYAHERGVIHRDVKPDNLFLQEASEPEEEGEAPAEERVLLADFGLATRLDDASLTREGTVVGTPLYMAPEQARGERDRVDRRTDVYGLGATLYELLTGVPPFDGSPDTQTLLVRIRDEDIVPVRARAREIASPGKRTTRGLRAGLPGAEPRPLEVPPALDAVVGRTLEKDLDRRYPTARELAEDLERFLRGDPVLARPANALEKIARYARRRAFFLATVAALVVAGAVGFSLAIPMQQRWQAESLVLRANHAKTPPEEARRLVQEALSLVPSHADARARLAALLLAENDGMGARAELDRAIADEPGCVEARLLRGDLLRKAGNLDAAWSDLEVALRVARDEPRVAYARGAVLAARGKHREAVEELERGLERARAARVRASEDAGYREAIRLSGEERFHAGDFPGAQQDLEEAIRHDPSAASPRVLLGRALVAQGLDFPAIEAFSDALRRVPGDPDALEQRAAARRRLGRVAEAYQDLTDRALETRARGRLLRGLLISESMDHALDARNFDYRQARSDLLAGLSLSNDVRAGGPPLEDAERVRGLCALAWVELALGEGTEARAARAVDRAEAAIQTAPREPGARLARGLLLLRAGRGAEARADLEAVRSVPAFAYAATFGLAKLALRERREDDARALLRVACELAPGRPAAHALRARLLAEGGDVARAREERKLSLATLGAEARPARDEDARPRVPLHDVSDPLEAAERAAARGIEAFDQALAAPGRSGVYGLAMQRAGAWLRRAWLHDPDRGHVAAKLAQVQYLLGDAAGAATTYAAAKALDPLLIEADVMHGVLQRDFGIDGGAKAAPAALERAARAASRPEGDADLAARAFFELARAWDEVGETDRALEACEEACRRGAERHAPVALKARLLSRLQRPEARQASRLAAVLLHRAPQPIEASRALVYQRAGEYCEDLNDVRAAVHFFTRAIESDPSNPVPWRRRGGRLFRTSPLEFPHAFLDITTAIELDPALASHFHDVERSLYRFRAFSDEFQDRVSEVVRAAPDMASALFVGGFWESFRGNPAEAKARFDEALELAPKWYLPLAYRGVCRVRLDDLAGAESDLREARRLWAKDGVIPFFEAALALRRGDKEGCYAKLREAITLEFKHGEIFRGSPDLAPLAGEARFERILDELGGDDGLFQFRRKKN